MPDRASLAALDSTPHAEVFAAAPRTVRLALGAGESMPAHSHPGRNVVVHVVEGRLRLGLDGESELSAGDIVRFDGAREVAPEAVTDCVAVVVLAAREE